jgi:hypothetical protein
MVRYPKTPYVYDYLLSYLLIVVKYTAWLVR